MRASSPKVAKALVTRLNDIVPAPFRLSAQDNLLHIYVGNTLYTTSSTLDIVEDQSRDLTERLETAVHSVIDQLQDDVSEHLRIPWPSLDGRTMAVPEVHSDGRQLNLWYGDEREPVLKIAPILIAEIMENDELAI